MTRLLAGSAGGGGSVAGAANMAAAWCWCWAWERSAKCEVERWAPGPCGDRDACFVSPRLALLLALLLLLWGWGTQWPLAKRAPTCPSPSPGSAHLRLCRLLCAAWPWPWQWPGKAPRGRGTCVRSRTRGCGGAGGGCGVRCCRGGASFLTSGLAGAPGVRPVEGAGLCTDGRNDSSVLSSRLRSRPETLGAAPALASDFSPSVGPVERGPRVRSAADGPHSLGGHSQGPAGVPSFWKDPG